MSNPAASSSASGRDPSTSADSIPPIWAKRLLSNREQDTAIAYELQVKGAREGALRWTAYSLALSAMGGMVIWADHYLLRHERILRKTDDLMRRQAREDLAKRGIILTESELSSWKNDQLESLRNPTPAPPST